MPFTESNYENAVLQLFTQTLDYSHAYGPDIERDYHSPLYEDELLPALQAINPFLPQSALDDAVYKLKNFESGSLLQKNMVFTDYLQNGVPVKFVVKGEEHSGLVYLVDYQHPENNSFTAVNQWTVIENSEKRADVVLFVNGLPLVVVELKSPSREETDASAAYRQLRNYMHEIPSLFIYNQICVMSDLTTSKAGTITSGEDRFMAWKTKDGSYENTQYAQFDTFFEGIFQKERFLDILQNFICFNVDGANTFKVLAGYHQYFAVKKAVESTQYATVTDGKGGVFWHTQGSGKSLSMVFYAHYLQKALESPTIVVITDRNDLDNQLYGQFSRCKDFLRQTPQQAESRQNLQELLAGRQANGIIFTTMQKFEETGEPLSERRNIVVMADEAHRGQYGLTEKVVTKQNEKGELEVKTSIGTARIIRDSLPNATYIGFTGTPISSKDRSTREVFGDYIDIYDMTQAVEDEATRPVYYESRVIHLKLDENTLRLIDAEYDLMAQNADPYVIEKSKKELGQMEAILGNDQTIASLVDDILDHYENYRANLLTGKAMIVAYSRPIAMKIYKRILQLRPGWTEKVGVVMTQGNNDPEEWREIIGNSQPRFHYGTTLSMSWAGIDFSIFFQGIGRRHWYPKANTIAFWGPYARPYASWIPKDFHEMYWSEENPDAYFPRPRGYVALSGTNRELTAVNDRYMQNIRYCRLKNLTIGYTLPKKWTRKVLIENLRVYFTGENLATWSPIHSDYIDPEMAAMNDEMRTYPWQKTYMFGVDVTF
jgi:type I restriction enzyme R subunit